MVNHGGAASLIGDSGMISLDGQSVILPDDQGYCMDDDISSINDFSYCRGSSVGGGFHHGSGKKIQIVGTLGGRPLDDAIENGHATTKLSPAAIAMNQQMQEPSSPMSPYLPPSKCTTPAKKKQNPRRSSNSSSSVNKQQQRRRKRCGVPYWISEAPRWLKFVIAFSTAMLVGAVVLVTVALATALTSRGKPANNANLSGLGSSHAPGVSQPGGVSSSRPTVGPLVYSRPTFSTSSDPPAPTPDVPPQELEGIITGSTTPSPTRRPAYSPTNYDPPVYESTVAASDPVPTEEFATEQPPEASTEAPYDPDVITFFVTGGRFTNNLLAQVPEQLGTMPVRGGTSFMVHLGDWNSPYATGCDEQSYQDVNDLFSNSSIPVYFLPGDNDYNDCPNPTQALGYWHEYLLSYETQHWEDPTFWAVEREQTNYPENFAFVYGEILFIGINLVGGVVHDPNEWYDRQQANLKWIDDNYQKHSGSIRALVLFAHADPDVPSNGPFYEPLKERVKDSYNQIPVVLIHRNLGVEPWGWESEYEDIPNFSVIVVAGSVWPPLMGAVDFRKDKPFIFDQSDWYDEYIQYDASRGL